MQGLSDQLDILFGRSTQKAGAAFQVQIGEAIHATKSLLPIAKKMPNGFEVWSPSLYGEVRDSGGRGVGGLLINGKYHSIRCTDDYWVIGATADLMNHYDWERHYTPRDIATENHGIYQVKAKKGRSDLSKLLAKLQKFFEAETAEVVQVVFG